jgi:N-methylhydantoinase A/oxoprolinase/acetone carboxylase beta subunit
MEEEIMTDHTPRYLMGVDIGGTFTDGVLLDQQTGRVWATKVLTTQNHEQAALAAIDQLGSDSGAEMSDVAMIAHATTLASNTVILGRGARVGLLTNSGFEDILHIGREGRYDTYNLLLTIVEPLVERSLCRGVPGRLLADGTEYAEMPREAVTAVAAEWKDDSVEAVAVTFLHSYIDDCHEAAARACLNEVLGDPIPVSLSAEVSPEMREYERACTTVLNAYLQPVMGSYQSLLEKGLADAGYQRRMYVMLSSGGITTTDTASRFPVRMLESGPVAGVYAAAHVVRQLGGIEAVGLDVGGTTAKIALITDGEPARSGSYEVCRTDRFTKGSGIPVQLPSIDLLEIGAGGGSIARVDALGFLQVGPESAESNPGPACYGRGGTQPTVTDAAVVLGYIDPETFAGGSVKLDAAAARAALGRVGSEVGLSVEDSALTVLDVLNESMAQSVRVHLAERGQEPGQLVLVASGGGGPMHGVEVARRVGIPEVVVPRRPGVLSALGLVVTPPAIELAQSHVVRMEESTDWNALNLVLAGMHERAVGLLEGTGVDAGAMQVEWAGDVRWIGQTHTFRIPLPLPPYGPTSAQDIVDSFNREAVRLHGAALQPTVLEVLTWRITLRGRQASVPAEPLRPTGPSAAQARVYVSGSGWQTVPVLDRDSLGQGPARPGPALISDSSSTCAIGAQDRFAIDEWGNLRITVGGSSSDA